MFEPIKVSGSSGSTCRGSRCHPMPMDAAPRISSSLSHPQDLSFNVTIPVLPRQLVRRFIGHDCVNLAYASDRITSNEMKRWYIFSRHATCCHRLSSSDACTRPGNDTVANTAVLFSPTRVRDPMERGRYQSWRS